MMTITKSEYYQWLDDHITDRNLRDLLKSRWGVTKAVQDWVNARYTPE